MSTEKKIPSRAGTQREAKENYDGVSWMIRAEKIGDKYSKNTVLELYNYKNEKEKRNMINYILYKSAMRAKPQEGDTGTEKVLKMIFLQENFHALYRPLNLPVEKSGNAVYRPIFIMDFNYIDGKAILLAPITMKHMTMDYLSNLDGCRKTFNLHAVVITDTRKENFVLHWQKPEIALALADEFIYLDKKIYRDKLSREIKALMGRSQTRPVSAIEDILSTMKKLRE
jgi:hypothetical protein